MGTCIIKLEAKGGPYYLEWSSVVDAPVTYGMTLNEFKKFYEEEYGRRGLEDLKNSGAMERVEETGSSSRYDGSVEDVIEMNRAGPDETALTLQEIIQKYCIDRPTK